MLPWKKIMQPNLSTIFIIFLTSIIMILYLNHNIVFYNVFAISSFGRVPLGDVYYPCTQFGYNNDANENFMIESDCLHYHDLTKISTLPLPVDITGITYLSSEETFNATLWLDYPLYDNKYSDYVDANLTFIMFIYDIIREEYSTNIEPTNFIYIYPELDGNWTYKFFEADPFGDRFFEADPYERTNGRLIESNYNYNNFYQNGKKFVHIPFNLNYLGNPEKFAVSFTMIVDTDYSELNFLKNKGKEFLIDTTNWDSIPPGELLITFKEPAKIKVAAGEGKKVEEPISINSMGLNVEERMILSDGNKTDGIDLSFNPSEIDLPLNGTRYTEMIIHETSKELKPKIYNAISVNVTRGLINASNLSDLLDLVNYTEAVTIEILNPLTFVDRLNNFLIYNYGLFIIPLGITTIFAIFVSKRVNREGVLNKIGIDDLLSIDGSVIVGVLVFLTLGTLGSNQGMAFTLTAILTSTIVFPFALSAIATLLGRPIETSIKLTIPGFIYLMVSIVLVAYIQYQSSV
jgi:hypothetical protein